MRRKSATAIPLMPGYMVQGFPVVDAGLNGYMLDASKKNEVSELCSVTVRTPAVRVWGGRRVRVAGMNEMSVHLREERVRGVGVSDMIDIESSR